MSRLVSIITAGDPAVRNQALDAFCRTAPLEELLAEAAALEEFRRRSDNLYERVRALFFLYAIYRFHLPSKPGLSATGLISFDGYSHLLRRRFEEAIELFLATQRRHGPSDGIASALAVAYHDLGFQTLANQVRRSVRSVLGNQWMFRVGHPSDQPLRLRPELLRRSDDLTFPLLRESTPVRMDLSHSGWSDIFFLGMDFPEGARVLNISIDLAVRGRGESPRPPVEAYLRAIDEPLLRLASVDLGASADITDLSEVFDFAKDYLGLLKAAVIAAGIVPPGLEGSGESLQDLLARVVGPGCGLELVSSVNAIPRGSRLAVSTSLLAALIAVCMRATAQTQSLVGGLGENERRLVAARAILGEWLAGSGGGWQDSGGVWPGAKLIQGVLSREGDPEFGISRGRRLPDHTLIPLPDRTRQRLQDSLVLVHGGMAQNVGPILEMVTEKYLLRSEAEWRARREAMGVFDEVVGALRAGDVPGIGAATTRNFFGPIQAIIPWATNSYTETLIDRIRERFGPAFWGFWMLGGMSGGGMGFIFSPEVKVQAQEALQDAMSSTKRRFQYALPFAMEPVVYDFAINGRGSWCDILQGDRALLPSGYYAHIVPALLKEDRFRLPAARRAELDKFGNASRSRPELSGMVATMFDRLFPRAESDGGGASLSELLDELGFDRVQHERIRADLRGGRIGLAQNRLPRATVIEDVRAEDVVDATGLCGGPDAVRRDPDLCERGLEALRNGEAAVVTLAAGIGSRWTQGAGVVKALNPFCKLGGAHRSFLDVHLAKSRRIARLVGAAVPHIVTTSYLTHEQIAQAGFPVILSPGRAVGLRLVPMERDLRFAWEEVAHQILDEQKQKVADSLHAALIGWAKALGEGNDYTDNLPGQCLHPVGHWFEFPNMLRNGVLARLLAERPQLRTLMVHNIDTVGADLDPAMLGLHLSRGAGLSFEVISRRIEDRGGGLARVNGRARLVEGLAMPREEDEFGLSYYNSMTTWIDIDKLLLVFGLSRADLGDQEKVSAAIRRISAKMPTYITLKDVKKRWGHGQEDIFPVAQFEKLWSDMTALPEVDAGFFVVPRMRGQQLKDVAQLDGWLRDGSAAYVESICDWR